MKRAFSYEGRQLEVQAVYFDDVWLLSVFENGSPASTLQYQVTGSMDLGTEGSDLLETLMAIVAEDFRRSTERSKAEPTDEPVSAEKLVDLASTAFGRKLS